MDEDDTLMIESEPTPAADTLHSEDETGGCREDEPETAPERTADKSQHKNMFRAFDGTALIIIGNTL